MSSEKRGRDEHDVEPVDQELAKIIARARNLSRAIEPDLWPRLARRIADAPQPRERSAGWAGEGPEAGLSRFGLGIARLAGAPAWAAVATAAVLLVVSTVFATLWWTGQVASQSAPQQTAVATPLPASDAEARQIADALRGRDGMSEVHESLLRILDQRREELPAQTVAALEENLLIIDHAITEIYRAMEKRADSHTLNLLLAETYRREAELLRQLEWWIPAHEERSS